MSGSANFYGESLRLTAYLRVVEKEPPQRPTRFRKRIEHADEEEHVPSTADGLDVPTRTEVDAENHAVVSSQDQNLSSASQEQKANQVKKASQSSSSHKRRLPVKSLPLLRTTTLDGLPGLIDPENASDDLSLHEAETIDGSNSTKLENKLHKRVVSADTAINGLQSPLKHTRTRKIQRYQKRPVKALIKTLPTNRSPNFEAMSARKSRFKTCFEADAFEGHELSTVVTYREKRKETLPRAPVKKTARPVLSLLHGNLRRPMQPDHVSPDSSGPALLRVSDHRKATAHALPTPADRYVIKTSSDQLSLCQSAPIISNQLSSVNAPFRMQSTSTCSEMLEHTPDREVDLEENEENQAALLLDKDDFPDFSDQHMQLTPDIESSCVEVTMERRVSID